MSSLRSPVVSSLRGPVMFMYLIYSETPKGLVGQGAVDFG